MVEVFPIIYDFYHNFNMKEIKRLQKLAGIITESTFDSMKQRLLSFGYPEDKVQTYCNDLESYGDEEDYEDISDEELKDDFETYSGEINEMPQKFNPTPSVKINDTNITNNVIDYIKSQPTITRGEINTMAPTGNQAYGVYFWWVPSGKLKNLEQEIYNDTGVQTTIPYKLRNIKGDYLVYIGKADNIRNRLGQHMALKNISPASIANAGDSSDLQKLGPLKYDAEQFRYSDQNMARISRFLDKYFVFNWITVPKAIQVLGLDPQLFQGLAPKKQTEIIEEPLINALNPFLNARGNNPENTVRDLLFKTSHRPKTIRKQQRNFDGGYHL
jgi:hypothetical protein